jgi:hypothetical protein
MATLDAKLKQSFYMDPFVDELAGKIVYGYSSTQIRIYVIPSEPMASLNWSFDDVYVYPYYSITIRGALRLVTGKKLVGNDTLDPLINMIQIPNCRKWGGLILDSLGGINDMTSEQLAQLAQKLNLPLEAPMQTRCFRRPIINKEQFVKDISYAYIMSLQNCI